MFSSMVPPATAPWNLATKLKPAALHIKPSQSDRTLVDGRSRKLFESRQRDPRRPVGPARETAAEKDGLEPSIGLACLFRSARRHATAARLCLRVSLLRASPPGPELRP